MITCYFKVFILHAVVRKFHELSLRTYDIHVLHPMSCMNACDVRVKSNFLITLSNLYPVFWIYTIDHVHGGHKLEHWDRFLG